MNYVNIQENRINLNNVTSYSEHEKGVFLNLVIYDNEDGAQAFIFLPFNSQAEAQQCIDFLDNKTKMRGFQTC